MNNAGHGKLAPIFIVGVEHSGTTILYRILAQHPEIAWFSQYSLRSGEIPGRRKVPLNDWINRIGRKTLPTTWRKSFKGIYKLIPTPMEPHQIWNHLLPGQQMFFTTKDCNSGVFSKIIYTCQMELNDWQKPHLIIKLPRLSRAVLLLNAVFPDAFFVHIIRDGKAVALSNQHKFARSPLGAVSSLRLSCGYWRDVVNHLLEAQKRIGESRFLLTKYEHLCEDVKGTLSRICEFCHVPYAAQFFRNVPQFLKVTNDRWYTDASIEERQLINEILSPTLEEVGYTPFDH